MQDLWEAVSGGSLSRWLRQQNESELANQIKVFCHIEKPSIEDYIKFSSLFFEKEMKGVPDDANTLVKFYKERNLKKNFRYAFLYLLDSLDYQNGKAWYDEYRDVKSDEDWIAFFDARLSQLQDEEKIECYQFLCKLYGVNNEAAKMDYCQSKAKDLIINLAKEDKGKLDKWLASGNYFYVKLLYENEIIRGLKSNNDWLIFFERCKDQLLATQQGECFYYLYLLSKASGEEVKAKDYLEKSANLGYEDAEKRIYEIRNSYPKLTEILNQYRNENKSIGFSDLDNIIQNLLEIEKEDEYYRVCRSCILMLKDYEHPTNDLPGINGLVNMALARVEYSIDAKTNRFPKYASLIVLVGALCGENKDPIGSNARIIFEELNKRIESNSPYKSIFQLKLTRQKAIITAEKGLKCDLRTASIVEQVIFFLETHGESYSIKN